MHSVISNLVSRISLPPTPQEIRKKSFRQIRGSAAILNSRLRKAVGETIRDESQH